MLKNYILVALRNLWRQRGYTLINIFGLTIGLASTIFILLYVINELTYDRFHEKSDQIHRVWISGSMPATEMRHAVTSPPMAEALLNEYPEVEQAVRIRQAGGWMVRRGDRIFQETDAEFMFADSTGHVSDVGLILEVHEMAVRGGSGKRKGARWTGKTGKSSERPKTMAIEEIKTHPTFMDLLPVEMDLVEGLIRMMNGPADLIGPLNLGNPDEYTMLQLAETVIALTGASSQIVHEPLPQDDPVQRQPDIDMARKRLQWQPRVDLQTGLTRTIDYFKSLVI